ncbi:Peroxisomal biogenesis factor 8 [Hypsizygus marmoreus]|uniref:Peroxisomal biogenesis factor 8 n=1 Tax=Hypsizygus marmoreus TaxID=39966 RepID=A0A369J4E4_HYPMA|nr:Peroxisomal biogenesis factor 8 [Hypsizygus marmoreus]
MTIIASMSTSLLLTHLQNTDSNVPLPTLTAALAHHLAVDSPLPTPLAAAAVSSPFFLIFPPTHDRLQGLVNAFRHALHLKHQALVKSSEESWSISRAVFSKSVQGGVNEWVRGVLRGLQGGRPVLRLACSVGVLLGVKGLEKPGVSVARVEDEIIIALAEVMDDYSADAGDWEREFGPGVDESVLSLTLLLASQALPLIPTTKLKALPLSLLARFLTSTISSSFHHGTFLRSLPESTSSGKIHIPISSSVAQTIQGMSSSPTMAAMASLSKLTALVLGTLKDDAPGGLNEASETLHAFKDIASNVENDWELSGLAGAKSDDDIAQDTRELSKTIWFLLKTLLFSTIMVADGVLKVVVYARPVSPSQSRSVTPQTIAQTTLKTLFHISFVVSQFGGVTATATSEEPGFIELRKVFYLGIDVLSSQEPLGGSQTCERFVQELANDLRGVVKTTSGAFEYAKVAYVLSCIEQLVPLLGTSCLKDHVWGLCVPYLSDATHRETYESAHSVVLSIFASHAQQNQPGDLPHLELPGAYIRRQVGSPETEHESLSRHPNGLREVAVNRETTATVAEPPDVRGFVHRMVPYYAQCLIENSEDGKLSTAQLRLAYAALVRSACTSPSTAHDEARQLGWYCVTVLIDAIRDLSLKERNADKTTTNHGGERLHRLHLTLISTIPSLPLPLMIRALEEIRSFITSHPGSDGGVWVVRDDVREEEKRKELVEALFAEILGQVGDREKEAAMRWWYANRANFVWGSGDGTIAPSDGVVDSSMRAEASSGALSRL